MYKPARMREYMKDALYNSVAQGILKITFHHNWIIKIFWLLTLLLTLGVCIWQIVLLVFSFLEANVTTVTRSYYENPTKFPTVTICDKSFFTTDFGLEFVQETMRQNKIDFDGIFNASNLENDKVKACLKMEVVMYTRFFNFLDTATFFEKSQCPRIIAENGFKIKKQYAF